MADFLLILPILLLSVVAHEYAHAWMAYRQGDTTAYMLGRLTFNPIPHIDPWMSIIVPVLLYWYSHGAFTFGAAKPVPVNPRNYRNYKRGDILVSLAGIMMNCLIALICAGIFILLGSIGHATPELDWLETLQRITAYGVLINLILAVFNLFPLPPLDGSHVFYHLLPPALGARYRAVGRYGFALIILGMWLVPSVNHVVTWPVLKLTSVAERVLEPWSLSPVQ